MSDETATDDPAAAPRRLPAKLWLVGGAAALLSALVGGTVAWLLMATPAKPLRTPAASVAAAASAATKAASAAAETAAAAAASAAEAPAAPRAATATPVVVPAGASSGPVDGEPGAAQVAAAGAESTAAGAASTASVAPRLPAVAAGPDRSPNAAPVPLPLERLRRRLDEVLAGRGRVAAGEGGELRVVSANALQPAPAAPPNGKARHDERAPGSPQAAQPHWHYGDGPGGPRQWGGLKAEFAACTNGRRQSPIDIRDGLALDLEPLTFEYRPGAFSVLDNGHTVQVDVAPGNVLVAGGRRYALQQFHFHRPSEERIDGRRYDMDVHLVHRGDDGRLAVVAVLLERGEPLPVLQAVWNHLPLERGEASTPTVPLDPAELLPADRRYATYMGSLTTPPCTEGVLWIVLRQPVGVAQRQVDIFARLYPMNARPLQASAGRLIKQSN